ncbi:sulfotransferase family protein [Algibacillus agarilyticus]|uniref:sulfotransferase family protein n=1 Tax=Algibacillus agarilyticus TaxID=2234133 RepID=UPI0018E57FCD|nr:sulfotransferase family protein [Algibacillus agarilyticus]
MISNKIFIIGLPRTATTSVCVALLELGFKTAHTAYTKKAMLNAQVIADTPIFADYQQLDKHYPNARFINLTRDLTHWLPSIQQLLTRMHTNVTRDDGGFNPIIKRCYQRVFSPFTLDNINNTQFLTQCYEQHQQGIQAYFSHRPNDLLNLDVSQPEAYAKLLAFLKITQNMPHSGFSVINKGGKVTAWNKIKHPNKIESTNNGKIDLEK